MYLLYEKSCLALCGSLHLYTAQLSDEAARLELCRSRARRDGYMAVVLPHVMKAIATRESIDAEFSRDVAAAMSRSWDAIPLEGVAGARLPRPLLKVGKQRSTLPLQASCCAVHHNHGGLTLAT